MENSVIPQLGYLFACSIKSLQDLEMASLNRSQECLRAAKLELEQAIAQREVAGVARWLIEHRGEISLDSVNQRVVNDFDHAK